MFFFSMFILGGVQKNVFKEDAVHALENSLGYSFFRGCILDMSASLSPCNVDARFTYAIVQNYLETYKLYRLLFLYCYQRSHRKVKMTALVQLDLRFLSMQLAPPYISSGWCF